MTNSAVIYCRISKDVLDNGLGVDRQERLCRELAASRGLDVVDVLVDNDLSAFKSKSRPAFEQTVAALTSGRAGSVICYHVDRLYRRMGDLERIVDVVEQTGAQVHTVAAGDLDLSTASGRMIARMLGAAAQHESERLGERSKAKHDELAMNGRPAGGKPPFGYRRVPGSFEIDETEAEVVRYICRRAVEGASLLRIGRELTDAGHRTRTGAPWHPSTVRAIAVNPTIAGLRVHRRERHPDGRPNMYAPMIAGPGNWPAIIDRAHWDDIVAQLKDPARKRSRPATTHMLSGLVRTPGGLIMNGGRDRYKKSVYMTRQPSTGGQFLEATGEYLTIASQPLEDFVRDAVFVRTDKAALAAAEPVETGDGGEVAALEADLADLAALRGAGEISLQEWMAARKPLQARLDEARQRTGARRPDRVDDVLSRPGALRAQWPSMDVDERRRAVSALVERVVIGPATRGRWTTLAERVDPDKGFGIVWRV